MIRIKHFAGFLEALRPSQFRRFVQAFNRERYTDIFKKYEGDRNHYRIYLPLKGEKLDMSAGPEKEVTDYLAAAGYEVLDYVKGTCRFKDAKNPSKIGQVLTKLGAKDDQAKRLMKAFVEDEDRKAGSKEQLMVVISRHPYDIAGADTDRDWTNCMTMAHGTSQRVTKKYDEVERLRRELRQVKQEWQTLEQEIDERKIGKNFTPSVDREQRLKELQRKDAEIDTKINDLLSEIGDREETGANAKYLLYDVKEGSLISYLVRKDDLDIKNPVSVLNIKPYIREADEDGKQDMDDFVLVSDDSMYGKKVDAFKATVDAWLDEVNGEKFGRFELHPSLYADSDRTFLRVDPSGLEKLKTVRGVEKWISDNNLEEEFDEALVLIQRSLVAIRGKEIYADVLRSFAKYISTVREYPGMRAVFMQSVMSDDDLDEDLVMAVAKATKSSLERSAILFYWNIRQYLYNDTDNGKVFFDGVLKYPETAEYLKAVTKRIYFFRNALKNEDAWTLETSFRDLEFGKIDEEYEDHYEWRFKSEPGACHGVIEVRGNAHDVLFDIYDYKGFVDYDLTDYVYSIADYGNHAGYVAALEPKDAERLVELLDTRVVEVTDDNNELTMNIVDLDTPKKKKENKNKKSKNESRISGFGDFRV
jgi:hypothetical protein